MGSKRVGHDLATEQQQQQCVLLLFYFYFQTFPNISLIVEGVCDQVEKAEDSCRTGQFPNPANLSFSVSEVEL